MLDAVGGDEAAVRPSTAMVDWLRRPEFRGKAETLQRMREPTARLESTSTLAARPLPYQPCWIAYGSAVPPSSPLRESESDKRPGEANIMNNAPGNPHPSSALRADFGLPHGGKEVPRCYPFFLPV